VGVVVTPWEAFLSDLELAGSDLAGLEEALGMEVSDPPSKAAVSYVELLLKIRDSRHGG